MMQSRYDVISGKWKLEILYALAQGTLRWSTLIRILPQVAPNVLTRQLRALMADGLVFRSVQKSSPPFVVAYGLTEEGKQWLPTVERLAAWNTAG